MRDARAPRAHVRKSNPCVVWRDCGHPDCTEDARDRLEFGDSAAVKSPAGCSVSAVDGRKHWPQRLEPPERDGHLRKISIRTLPAPRGGAAGNPVTGGCRCAQPQAFCNCAWFCTAAPGATALPPALAPASASPENTSPLSPSADGVPSTMVSRPCAPPDESIRYGDGLYRSITTRAADRVRAVQSDPGSKDERVRLPKPHDWPRPDTFQVEINTRWPIERSSQRRRQRTVRLENHGRAPTGPLRNHSHRSKHRNGNVLPVLPRTPDARADHAKHRDRCKSSAASTCD